MNKSDKEKDLELQVLAKDIADYFCKSIQDSFTAFLKTRESSDLKAMGLAAAKVSTLCGIATAYWARGVDEYLPPNTSTEDENRAIIKVIERTVLEVDKQLEVFDNRSRVIFGEEPVPERKPAKSKLDIIDELMAKAGLSKKPTGLPN